MKSNDSSDEPNKKQKSYESDSYLNAILFIDEKELNGEIDYQQIYNELMKRKD